MPQDEFDRHKAALASNKLQKDTALAQEADRAWEQVRRLDQDSAMTVHVIRLRSLMHTGHRAWHGLLHKTTARQADEGVPHVPVLRFDFAC
jgi:hypothetical protein